jgi:hypothetical protein
MGTSGPPYSTIELQHGYNGPTEPRAQTTLGIVSRYTLLRTTQYTVDSKELMTLNIIRGRTNYNESNV